MSETPNPGTPAPDLPLPAVRLTCSPSTPAGTAVSALLAELGDRILLHRERVLASRDVDALHDLRVAVRRGRSVLSDVRGVIAESDRLLLRSGLVELGRASNALRDLDVLAEALAGHPRAADGAVDAGAVGTLAAIESRAACEREGLIAVLARPDVEGWLGHFRAPQPGPRAVEPLLEVARTAARRVWSRFLAAGETAVASGRDDDFHRMRIRGKRLRYALEFFEGVLGPERWRFPDLASLRGLQDRLGEHNDLVVQIPLLESLDSSDEAVQGFIATRVGERRGRLSESRRAIVELWHGRETSSAHESPRTSGLAAPSGSDGQPAGIAGLSEIDEPSGRDGA